MHPVAPPHRRSCLRRLWDGGRRREPQAGHYGLSCASVGYGPFFARRAVHAGGMTPTAGPCRCGFPNCNKRISMVYFSTENIVLIGALLLFVAVMAGKLA